MTLLSDVRNSRDSFKAEEIVEKYSWVADEGRSCVISPDADGQLCGLLMSSAFGWKISGFYDGKVLLCDKNVNPRDLVYLDMEIYRDEVMSMGNHMLAFNRNRLPEEWDGRFSQCISFNNIRGHDRRVFRRKYPFATIHGLLVLASAVKKVPLTADAVGPLMFADGAYKIMLQYTENAWDWMRYLGVEKKDNPLHRYFLSPDLAVYQLMTKMLEFWERRDQLSVTGQRGDRIAVTERGGEQLPINLLYSKASDSYSYENEARGRSEEFLEYLGELTKWKYEPKNWSWGNWSKHIFAKETLEVTSIPQFTDAMKRNPISLAITAQNRLEIAFPHDRQPDPFSSDQSGCRDGGPHLFGGGPK